MVVIVLYGNVQPSESVRAVYIELYGKVPPTYCNLCRSILNVDHAAALGTGLA